MTPDARRLAELAAREESAEIATEKAEKVRKELEARDEDVKNRALELEGKTARLRDLESKRAEELRTWQTTLESQQALLKEQGETFEQESASQREAWAARVMRLERREIDVKDQEEKARQDVEWITRNQEEIGGREKAAQEALQSGSTLKAEADQLKGELDQRVLELDSRERSLREEIARHATDLATDTTADRVTAYRMHTRWVLEGDARQRDERDYHRPDRRLRQQAPRGGANDRARPRQTDGTGM